MALQRFAPFVLLSVLTFSACPNSPSPSQPLANNQTEQRYYLPLSLGNGQDIHLDMKIQDKKIQGELIVSAAGMRTQLFSRSFAFGRYNFSGSFTPPRGFSLSGVFPEPIGAFSLSGVLPTQTEAGSFEFTQGSETVSDTLPALNTLPSPPPQPSPMPSTSSVTASPSPTGKPTASPIVVRQWTAAELKSIRECFSALTAAYQGESRTLVIQTATKIAANVSLATNPDVPWSAQQRQDKLNEAGEFALNSEAKLGSNCIP